jgi:hypothetical protein
MSGLLPLCDCGEESIYMVDKGGKFLCGKCFEEAYSKLSEKYVDIKKDNDYLEKKFGETKFTNTGEWFLVGILCGSVFGFAIGMLWGMLLGG